MAVLRPCDYWVCGKSYLLRSSVAVLRPCDYWVYEVLKEVKISCIAPFFRHSARGRGGVKLVFMHTQQQKLRA